MKYKTNVLKNVNGQIIQCVEEVEYQEERIIDSRPYEDRVVEKIRERYSINDELAILRQRDTKPEEFSEYNSYVEGVKQEIKGE